MRSGIEDFSRPFFAFIWPSRPQWAPLLPARGENGKRGSDIKKTLSPPPLDRGTRRDLGCRPRSLWQQAHPSLLWHCAGSAARRTHTPDPSRRDHTTHAGHGVCRRPQPPEQVPYRSFPHECENSLTSLFLLSKSNPLRWASIRFGTADRDHPHTASVLTWLKIEERQTFAVRSLYAPKRLCPKGFRLLQAVAPLEISLEIRRKQTDLPRGGLRPSERLMISWRI